MRNVMLLAVLGMMLAGCGMTNEQIISEVKKCRDAGMKAEALRNIDMNTVRIECVP